MSQILPRSSEEPLFDTAFRVFSSRGSTPTAENSCPSPSNICSFIKSTLQSLQRAQQTPATTTNPKICFERHLLFTGFPPQIAVTEDIREISYRAAMECLDQPLIYHGLHLKPVQYGSSPFENMKTVLMASESVSEKLSTTLSPPWDHNISIGDLPLPLGLGKAFLPSLVFTQKTSNGVKSYLQGLYGLEIHSVTRIESRCGDAAGPLGEEPLWLVEELEMKCPWPLSLCIDRIMREKLESGFEKLRTEWDARVRLLVDTCVFRDDAS